MELDKKIIISDNELKFFPRKYQRIVINDVEVWKVINILPRIEKEGYNIELILTDEKRRLK